MVVTFGEGSFEPHEEVNFTVEGATVVAPATVCAISSGPVTHRASGDGVASLTVTLPAEASGAYVVAGVGRDSGATVAFSLDVAEIPAAGGSSAAAITAGISSPMLLIWAASGVLLLGVALVLVRTTVRRQGAAA